MRALLAMVSCASVICAAAATGPSAKQARQAFTHIPEFQLKSGAVRVKNVTTTGATSAEVAAELRLVFKFETDNLGHWQVTELRSGQDKWEAIDLIAGALNAPAPTNDCTSPDPPLKGKLAIDPSVRRARCLLGSLLGIDVPTDALRIQEVDPMPVPLATQPSATVVAWVKVDARLVNDGGWQVTEVRTGKRDWIALAPLIATLNDGKAKRAREELAQLSQALEDFRKDRGFYVVSDSQAVAVDHLNPHYLARVIRIDPWNHPYEYRGSRDGFTLRSAGPDGKPNTADDIVIASR